MATAELTDWVWSNAKIKQYRRCPRAFYYKYILGIKKRTPALPLKRGSWIHELLMVHYDGHDWKEKHHELTAKFNELFEEEREEYGDLPGECHRIFTSYLMHWARQDKHLRVVDSELDEEVELPNGERFNFIIDLIVEEPDGGLWLWDHKTHKTFAPEGFMLIDAQLARYFWAAEKMGYRPLRGILFNELITQAPTVPKMLKSGRLEKRANLRCDVYTYYRTIKEHGQDPALYADFLKMLMSQSDRWFRRTKLPKDRVLTRQVMSELMMTAREIKEAEARGEWPRTPMKSCMWDCDYLDPCTIELNGGTIDQVIKLKYTTREDRNREEDGNG